jgi:hypothetical protein
MRAIRSFAVALLFLALPLLARDVPTISSISPDTLQWQSGEWFATLQGTHYLPSAGVTVIFSGPAGTIALTPNASTDTNMTVWVPLEVLVSPGDYSVKVRVPNGAGTTDSNSATLHISGSSIVIRVSSLVLAEAINLNGGPAVFDVKATGFFSDQIVLDCSHRSGDFFPFDTTTVDCVATDDLGGAEKQSFSVRVADTQPPAIEVPRDLLAFGKSDGTIVNYDAKAIDQVDPEVKLTCAPAPGSFFRLGTSSIECSSTDRFKNSGRAIFRVHVGSDVIPAMVIPSAFQAEAESREGAVAKFDATASNADGKAADVRCEPAAGSLFAMGTTQVKCIAWGPGGESTTDFFNLTVADTTAPQLSLSRDFSVQAPSAEGAIVTYGGKASDAVDGTLPVQCFPEPGSLFAPGQTIVNCSASDQARNIGKGSFVVTVLPWVGPDEDGLQ